jgi:hypothetical protein
VNDNGNVIRKGEKNKPLHRSYYYFVNNLLRKGGRGEEKDAELASKRSLSEYLSNIEIGG